MKRKLVSLTTALLMTLLIVFSAPFTPAPALAPVAGAWDGSLASNYYYSGTGLPGDPYTIPDATYLAKLASVVNAGTDMAGVYFLLTADIDLGTGGNSWTPIGTDSHRFKGVFIGGGKTVTGMTVRGVTEYNNENLGLFGVCQGALIRDLTLSNTSVYSQKGYVGALCGNAHGCTVKNVTVTGTLQIYSPANASDAARFGGMFGRINSPATISGCAVTPTSTYEDYRKVSAYSYYGGFVGDIRYENSGAVNIRDCRVDNLRIVSNRSSGNTETCSGGFFGYSDSADVTVNFLRCGVSNSVVSGYRYTGGFGYNLLRNSTMTGCYVSNTALTDLYSLNSENGSMQTGGLLGYSNGSVTSSYVSLSAFSAPNQSSTVANFIQNSSSFHSVCSVIGVRGGYSTATDVRYINVKLTVSGGMVLDVSKAPYGNGCGTETTSASVRNGELGWNLYDADNSVYWTQKDNIFTNTSGAFPVPVSTTDNMLVHVTEYGQDNTVPNTSAYKFSCVMNGTTSISTTTGTRVDFYINAGMTVVDSVTANSTYQSSAAYRWYFTRISPTDSSVVLNTYALEDKSFTAPAERDIRYVLHGETERAFTITYADPDGNTVVTSSGAPTSFTISSPADVSAVQTSNSYWALRSWQRQNGQAMEDISSVTVTAAGYSNITLYASWQLKSETGTDGKVYLQIYNYDNLENFRTRVNSGEYAINAKLNSRIIIYRTASVRTSAFTEARNTTQPFAVQSSTKRTQAELYYSKAYLTDHGYDVSTPALYTAFISDSSNRFPVAAAERYAANYLDSLGLKWGAYAPGQIGTAGSGFRGVFDGNGVTLSGLTLGGEVSSSNKYFGLFRHTLNATIKNLSLTGGTLTLTNTDTAVDYEMFAAPLVSNAQYTEISGCTVSVPIDTTALSAVTSSYPHFCIGCIVGNAVALNIHDCTATNTVTLGALSGSSYSSPIYLSVGGIIGGSQGSDEVTVSRCVRAGALTSTLESSDSLSLGGVIGWAQSPLTVTDCVVMSDVTADPTSGTAAVNPLYISGFAGRAGTASTSPVTFTRCSYGGIISNFNNSRYVGYSAFNGASTANTLYETWDCCYYDVYKNTDDYRIGSLVTTDSFTGGYMAWQLQKNYTDNGGTDQLWGQKALGSGNPVLSSDASETVRRVFTNNSTIYYSLGNPLGDTNGDTTINSADFTRILNGSVGISYANGGTDSGNAGADMSGDGVVDALDAMYAELVLGGHSTLS